MKKVVGGKIYDTKTARKIDSTDRGSKEGLNSLKESLYITKKGAYFLSGEGGPFSRYAVLAGNGDFIGGSGIVPMTIRGALRWCEQYSDFTTIEIEFGSMIEEA